jgi:hypothetical protein
MKLTPLLAAAVSFSLAACGDNPTADAAKGSETPANTPASAPSEAPASKPSGPPGTEAGAKELIAAFAKPGADTKALTAALKPTPADYTSVFTADIAAKVEAAHAPMWATNPAIGPKEGQTEARIVAAVTTAEIKEWNKNASDNLPGGYQKIKDNFKDGLTVYKFDFVKPGEDAGMSFDILVHVNGNWRLFPKPWRVAQ